VLAIKMIYERLRKYLFLLPLSLLITCSNEYKMEEAIAKIPVTLDINRFDLAFKNATSTDLPDLKQNYSYLFPPRTPDSVWVNKMTDSLQNILYDEVENHFRKNDDYQTDLKKFFKHLKFYNTNFNKVPAITTLVNEVDYRNRVIVTDRIILIALDNYLGADHEFYQNIPKYIASNLKASNIVVDIAEEYAKDYTQQRKRRRFIDNMVYFGKLLYFKDITIPFKAEHERINYTPEELQWAEANESAIWSYFVERELLFSTDPKLASRFLATAPFSKFYLELDNESPGKLGQYMGWQIVKAYAEATNKDLFDVLATDPEELFKVSKFKPKQ